MKTVSSIPVVQIETRRAFEIPTNECGEGVYENGGCVSFFRQPIAIGYVSCR